MKKTHNLLFAVCITVLMLMLGVGYATVNNTSLSISAHAGAAENGDIKITNVTLKTKTDNVTATQPVWSEETNEISFSVSFTLDENDSTVADERSATYEITLLNDTISNYSFGSNLFKPTLNITPPEGETLDYTYDVIGIQVGDNIPAKTSTTFTVKLTLNPSGGAGTYSGDVQTTVATEENNQGMVIGVFKNGINTGDLTGNNLTSPLTISVMNTYDTAKTFSFSITNNNLSIVDSNNNSNPTFTIPANTESQDFTIYIKRDANKKFGNSPQRFNLYLNAQDEDPLSVGTAEMTVDVDPGFYDKEPPTITSLTATKVSTAKSITVNWAATDNISVDHYEITAYDGNGNKVGDTINTTNTTNTFTNLSNGNYYFTLVAYDGKGNSSTQSTSSTAYNWTYTVRVTSCTNCSASPTTRSVDAGGTTTITFTGNNGYTDTRPNITSAVMTDSVTGNRTNINSNAYNSNTGVLTISNISGNVTITAEGVQNGTCLAKGTKILLANGNYKNVENIDYDDLLAVWNYNNGTITYEYPIWIEKEKTTNKVIRISFSDNTYLDIIDNHAIYSVDDKKFINLDDKEFKVGTKIAKIKNNKFETVKITNIETLNKKTTYYFVASTTYYNVIANDLLTTDVNTMISNLYGFEENATWPKEKETLVQNNKLDYKYFEDTIPYYLFKGFRVQEAGYLVNYNFITLDEFKYYITNLVLNPGYLRKPSNSWMVTTSLDVVNEINKKNYLYKEGSIYTLPINHKVSKWYSTSENKYYNPGDKIEVVHGMHFIAVYK